jgi:predicted RNase H-like HicB family nuclease
MTMFYTAIVEAAGDGTYGVFFPDVHGCVSAGDTVEEALANAYEALAFYFEEDDHRPPATPFQDVMVDADVKEVARAAIPAPETEGPVQRVNVTLPVGLLKQIDRRAGARNRSSFLTKAARLALVQERDRYD